MLILFRTRLFVLMLFWLGGGCPAGAESSRLKPDELLLVFNRNLDASRELASHYARVRGVPVDQVLGIDTDAGAEEVSADHFESQIRGPVRQFLQLRELEEKIRCVVTFYGVPIRVANIEPTPARQEKLANVKSSLRKRLDEFERLQDEIRSKLHGTTTKPSPRMPQIEDYEDLVQGYTRLRPEIWKEIARLNKARENPERKQMLASLVEKVEGAASVLRQIRPDEDDKASVRRYMQMVGQVQAARSQAAELIEKDGGQADRDKAFELIRRTDGLLGVMRVLASEVGRLRTDETAAAVDSQLMLLWWDDYVQHRWIWNPLSWLVRTDEDLRGRVPLPDWHRRVLMTARIDGPTPEIARRLIDQAIAAEKKGLSGRVYIDARGQKGRVGLGEYDSSLRALGSLVARHTDLVVRIDNESAVFGEGECPETMLYCGWYSLRRYVDAFDFVPGAVGYHIASFEAISRRKPNERGWCKGMLEDGITATLGPVAEPYLQSFPLPEYFFGLLLTGEYTLAECFAYTTNMTSWMQMLLGDPLYRPFAGRPELAVEQVFAQGAHPPVPAFARPGEDQP